MKIYVAHAGREQWDFEAGLYQPLIRSDLESDHDLILPYRDSQSIGHSEEIIKSCDLVVAEVSHPSTGTGIEMAWARQYGVPVLAIHQKGTKPTSSLQVITDEVFSYDGEDELIAIIKRFVSS